MIKSLSIIIYPMKIAKNTIPVWLDATREYIAYHSTMDQDQFAYMSEQDIATKLQDPNEDHKKWVFVLAHRDKPLAFHTIDDFQKTLSDNFMIQWCELAKQEAAMYI